MNFQEFKELADSHKTIPVYKRVMADLLTPISAYMRLEKDADHAFILESVENGMQYGRYSFIGRNPKLIVRSQNGKTQIFENGKWIDKSIEFLNFLREIHNKYHAPKLSGLPNFSGGLVGYLGYESITWMEDVPIYEDDVLQCPDALFMLFHELIAFDHLQNQIILFSNVQVEPEMDMEKAFKDAHFQIDKMGEDLHADINYQTETLTQLNQSRLISDFSKQNFTEAIIKAKEHIDSGDIFICFILKWMILMLLARPQNY